MKLESVVIHQIIKSEQSTGAELFLTETELDNSDPTVMNIISTLDASFAKKTIRRAKFSTEGFQSTISDFRDLDLVQVSRKLTEKLKDGIQNIPAAKGGYLVFCEYETTRKFLSIFLVRNTTGSYLKQADSSSWDVESTKYLDVEHFAMGARINLDVLLSESEDRYIHLVKGNTDISGYFEKWVGIDDKKQEAKDGDALYELSNHIDLPEDVDDRDAFKKQIFDYVSGKPSKIVNLRELSEYLYGDPNRVLNFCSENDIDIDGEFKLAGNQLKRFAKVSVSADGIKLEASRDKFNSTEISLSKDGEVVTIRSKELAAEIKKNID